MTWRDELQPASFRGVPFVVETTGAQFGRRTALHEYPQRDKPYSEDLGRLARKFTITGFVLEPDYFQKRDRLLNAIETAGPGELVHPFLGTMQVTLERSNLNESTGQGGMATFTLSFIEAGEIVFPSTSIDTKGRVESNANQSLVQIRGDFANRFSVIKRPGFVFDEAQSVLQGGLTTIQNSLGAIN